MQRRNGFVILGAWIALAASLVSSSAYAAPACESALTILLQSKSIQTVNDKQFCLSLTLDENDPAVLKGVGIGNETRTDQFTIAQLKKGITLVPAVLTLVAPSLDAANGGGATLSYNSSTGPQSSFITLKNRNGAWQLELYRKLVNFLHIGIEIGPKGMVIDTLEFSQK